MILQAHADTNSYVIFIPETAVYSTVCAIQNLRLAARTEGVGVGWVSILDPLFRSVLNIPDHFIPVAYLCLDMVHFASEPELERRGWENRIPLNKLSSTTGLLRSLSRESSCPYGAWQLFQDMVSKSLITAALCRIIADAGYRVAPFKSQNMSLNSAATVEGLEIGRAQALQAEAARIAPSVHMNPILLKPAGDMTSQVIVGGKIGRLSASDYHRRRVEELLPIVRESYETLVSRYDLNHP